MGASVVAIIVVKEKHMVAAFRDAGAMSPQTAVTPASIGVQEHVIFHRLRSRAVLREAGPGLFYLDDLSWQALRRVRQRMAIVALGMVLALGMAAWLVAGR